MWSTSSLNIAKAFHAGIFKNGKIYWAGGDTYIDDPWMGSNEHTCGVEIKDVNSQSTTSTNLSNPIDWVDWNAHLKKIINLFLYIIKIYQGSLISMI